MKQLIVVLAVIFTLTIGMGNSWAGDINNGAKVFSANCAACHAGGLNVINGAKTLKKDALEKYGMNSLDAITYQIIHGKNAMPAFANRLDDTQIQDVAEYILNKAEQGW